jgi:hypothetical protein
VAFDDDRSPVLPAVYLSTVVIVTDHVVAVVPYLRPD